MLYFVLFAASSGTFSHLASLGSVSSLFEKEFNLDAVHAFALFHHSSRLCLQQQRALKVKKKKKKNRSFAACFPFKLGEAIIPGNSPAMDETTPATVCSSLFHFPSGFQLLLCIMFCTYNFLFQSFLFFFFGKKKCFFKMLCFRQVPEGPYN